MNYPVTIKPNSRKGPLVEPQDDGSLVVYVREPAVEGRANVALAVLLAKYFGVPKTHVSIVRGQTSRYKTVKVDAILK